MAENTLLNRKNAGQKRREKPDVLVKLDIPGNRFCEIIYDHDPTIHESL